jgi:PAS domain-containing protein
VAGFRVGLGNKARPTTGEGPAPGPLPFSLDDTDSGSGGIRGDLLREQSPALEFLKDEAGHLVYYNRAFENVFAIDGGSLLGQSDAEWLPPLVAERVHRHDQTVLATGAVMEVEEALPSQAGTRHWLVLKFPLTSESGRKLLGSGWPRSWSRRTTPSSRPRPTGS